MPELSRWVGAVIRHFLLVGGGTIAGVIRIVVQQYAPNGVLAPSPFYALCALAFLTAIFLAWRDEHRSVVKSEAEKTALLEARPRFVPYLDAIITGGTANGSVVAVVVNLANHGSPSIAENWRTAIHGGDGTTRHLQNISLKSGAATFVSLDKTKDITLQPDSSIIKKALVPLTAGATCRGVLYFDVGHGPLLREGETLEITFKDAYRNPYVLRQRIERGHFVIKDYENLAMIIATRH